MLNKLYIAMYLCLFLIYSTVIAYIVCDKMIMFSRPTCLRRPPGSGNKNRRLSLCTGILGIETTLSCGVFSDYMALSAFSDEGSLQAAELLAVVC
jgi:hypothetical protein